MELTQLRQFKVIAECENLTKAAERLYVSQPALSQSLSKLENELGVKLFNRSKNSLSLNEAGKLALKYAEVITNEAEAMEKVFLEYKKSMSKINICSVSISAIRYLVTKFLADVSDVEISTLIVEQKEVESMLLSEECDLAFSFKPLQDKDFISMPYCEEIMYVSIPKSNKLSEKEFIYIKDLDNQKIVRPQDDSQSTKSLNKLFAKDAPHANVTVINDYWVFRETVKKTDSLFFVCNIGKTYYENFPDKKYVRIADEDLNNTVYLTYLKKKNAEVKVFTEWIAKNYKRLLI